MFSLTRPAASAIALKIAAARHQPVDGPGFLKLPFGIRTERIALEFAHDHSRSLLGNGEAVFHVAKSALQKWAHFDLSWTRVANPDATFAIGQVVAVEVSSLGLCTLNLSRVTETIDTPIHVGYIYSTTKMHVERGDERFLIEFDPVTGDVWYELEAVSLPRHRLARIGYPVTRAFQHRFARDSHRRMSDELRSLAG